MKQAPGRQATYWLCSAGIHSLVKEVYRSGRGFQRSVYSKMQLERPRGMEWGGRREEGSGWGTHVYLWRIHFDIWQN